MVLLESDGIAFCAGAHGATSLLRLKRVSDPPQPPKFPATESAPRQRRQSAGVPRVVVTQGPSASKSLLLTRARATLGRHQTNDLVIADPRVSSAHLELERRDEGRLVVRDLETTNGTWLGAHRVIELEV